MRADDKPFVVAAVISDVHMRHLRPVSVITDDWYQLMEKTFAAVGQIVKQHSRKGDSIPLLCCGDLFHHWNVPPELLNFALVHFPQCIAIPGQHDLPYHRLKDVQRSAYWTLAVANRISPLVPGVPYPLNDHVTVYGFPWGSEVTPPKEPLTGFNVALIHAYIWTRGHEYIGADKSSHLKKWAKRLTGYKVACFGDNHSGFMKTNGEQTILNCGSLFRARSDEAHYRPSVGLIWSNGKVTREELPLLYKMMTKEQVVKSIEENAGGFEEFIEEVRSLSCSIFNFQDVVCELMERRKVRIEVREAVMRTLEKKR